MEKKTTSTASTANSTAVSGRDTRDRASAVLIVDATNASVVLDPVSRGSAAARVTPPESSSSATPTLRRRPAADPW